jgi:hypothetical protein
LHDRGYSIAQVRVVDYNEAVERDVPAMGYGPSIREGQ